MNMCEWLSSLAGPFKTLCYRGDQLVITQGWKTHHLAWACGENWLLLGANHRYEIAEERPLDGIDKGLSKEGCDEC